MSETNCKHINDPKLPGPCFSYKEASSTQDLALELAREGKLPEWGSVLLSSQVAGRGQTRRQWLSPSGNLYVSIRLPKQGLFTSQASPVILGLFLAESLSVLGFEVKSKWPNDLLQYQDCWRKVGGILIEERGDIILAGIGLNLLFAPPDEAMRRDYAFPAGLLRGSRTDLGELHSSPSGAGVAIAKLWAQLAGALFSCYASEVEDKRHPNWLSLVPRRLAFYGKNVRLCDCGPGNREVCGQIEALAPDGALQLRISKNLNSYIENFASGSLSLYE